MIKRTLTTATAMLALAGGTAAVATTASAATTGHFPTRGYAHTCRAYIRWEAAGVPSVKSARTLARDVTRLGDTLPNQVLRADVSALLVAMVAGTGTALPGMWVDHDCHTD